MRREPNKNVNIIYYFFTYYYSIVDSNSQSKVHLRIKVIIEVNKIDLASK